jgi:DNA-directed RNA polymerase subunit RPC12/RpoP
MNNQKKYWCFNCNSECKIKIIKENEDNDEEYQCTKCNSTFIEEISNEDNPKDFHIEQTQSNNPTSSININNLTNFNLSINNVNSINIANAPTNSNNENTNDEYGMNDTLLFLPSTVNYKIRGNNTIRNTNNIFNSSFNHIITEIVTSNNNNNIFISRNLITRNSPILSFLSNHNNDNQFENLLNIIMSFDSIHKGNPPASQRAIDNLKKLHLSKYFQE